MMKNKAAGLLVLSVILTIALYHIPYGGYVAYPLLLISTVAHEMGHGLMAMLLGMHFDKLQMHMDGSGVAFWSGDPGRLSRALIAAAGLVGPAFFACTGLMAAKTPGSARWFLGLTGLGLLLAVLLVVRGGFAVIFIGLLALALVGLAAKASPNIVHFSLIFLCVQLSLSVFSRSDYLFTQWAGTSPSDVAHMAQALWLPYWFWGAVCGGISLLALGLGLRSVLSQE